MPNIPIRFDNGVGLEKSPARQIQGGLLQFEEVQGEIRNVAQKRPGGVEVGLALSPSESVNPDDLQALWYRDDELAIEGAGVLYTRPDCDTDADLVERGPWTRARLREIAGLASEAEVRAAARGRIDHCVLEATEVAASGIVARVIGDGIAAEFVLDPDGTDPKIAALDATRLVVSWVRNEGTGPISIQRALWSPGDTSVTPTTVVDDADLLGIDEQLWDIHADDTEGLVVWVWHASSTDRRLAIEESDGTTFGFSGQAAVSTAAVTGMSPRDAACYVSRRELASPNDVRVQVSFAGKLNGSNFAAVLSSRWTYTRGVGIVEDDDNLTSFGAAPDIRSVACGEDLEELDTILRFMAELLEATGERRCRLVQLQYGGPQVVRRSWPATTLVTNAVNMFGRPVVVLQPVGDPLVNNTAMWVSLAEGFEIVARSWLSQLRDVVDLLRQTTTMTISRSGELISAAVPGTPVAGIAVPPRLALQMDLDLTGRPNQPAVVDGVATSAHAGYPRVYDGVEVYEQDWHVLPNIASVTAPGGGTLPVGVYQIAVTWQWLEEDGVQYRSAPTLTLFENTGGDDLLLEYSLLTYTERAPERLQAEIWLSDPNGAELRLFARDTAFTDDLAEFNDILLNNVPSDDAEVLDLFVSGGAQGRVTDFMASAAGRLWSRDPQFAGVARHSLFRVLGSGRSWDLLGVVGYDGEPQEALTAAVEIDGRVVLGTTNSWLRVDGAGPSNAGVGAYPPPVIVPSSIGPTSQSATATYPDGVAYGSERGPYLLTRGLATRDLGALVSRQYEIEDGRIVAAVYDAVGRDVIVGDANRATLLWNSDTARWTESNARTCRDLARSLSARVAVLTANGQVYEYNVDTGTVFDAAQSLFDILGGNIYCEPLSYAWTGGFVDIIQAQPIAPTGGVIAGDAFSGAFADDAYGTQLASDFWAVTGTNANAILDPRTAGTEWTFAAALRLLSAANGVIYSKQSASGAGWSIGLTSGLWQLSVSDGSFVNFAVAVLPPAAADDVVGLVMTIDVDDPDTTYVLGVTTPGGTAQISVVTTLDASNGETLRSGAPVPGNSGVPHETDVMAAIPDVIEASPDTVSPLLQQAAIDGTGVTQFARLSDGGTPYPTIVGTPWLRWTGQDQRTTTGFRFDGLQILGECLGPHKLTIEKYDNFDDSAPTATTVVSLAQIMCLKAQGLPYQWSWNRQGAEHLLATRFVIRDNSPPHASFRLESMDVFVIPEGGTQYAELLPEQQLSDD